MGERLSYGDLLNDLDMVGIYEFSDIIDKQPSTRLSDHKKYIAWLTKINDKIVAIQRRLMNDYRINDFNEASKEARRNMPQAYFQLEQQHNEVVQQLVNFQQKHNNLKEQLDALNAKCQQTERSISQMRCDTEQSLRQYEEQTAQLQDELDKKEREITIVTNDFSKQQHELYQEHNSQLQNVLSVIEDNRQKNLLLTAENRTLADTIKKNTGHYDNLKKQLAQLQINICESRDSYDAQLAQAKQLVKAKQRQQNELRAKQQQMGESDAQVYQEKVEQLIAQYITQETSGTTLIITQKLATLQQLRNEEKGLSEQLQQLLLGNQLIERTSNALQCHNGTYIPERLNTPLMRENDALLKQVLAIQSRSHREGREIGHLDYKERELGSAHVVGRQTTYKTPTRSEQAQMISTARQQQRYMTTNKQAAFRIRNTQRGTTQVINGDKRSRYKLWRIDRGHSM